MADPKSFHCSLVTPEQSVLEAEAVYAEVPGHDGQIGLMRDRAPMVVKMGPGKLRLELADGSEKRYLIDGGFAQMTDNKLTLLSERALDAEQIDPDQARAALAEAQALRGETEEQFEKRQHDLAYARAMVELAG